jgi:hypothetical protein
MMMKNLNLKLILAVLAIGITFASCKKDEKDGGSFKYDGTTYETSHGYLSNPEDNLFVVILCSPDLTFSETDQDFLGSGEVLVMVLGNLESTTSMSTGNYIYPYTTETKIFVGAMAAFEIVNGSTTNMIAWNDGDATVELTKSENSYKLDYDVVMNSFHLTGTYKGSLESVTFDLKKKGKIYSFEF